MEKTPINRFIDYFSKPLTTEQILYLNNINNISYDRVEIYHDFIISLLYTINETYLGDDVIKCDDDRLSHFNWCWNKVIDNFNEENIKIQKKGEHFNYFYNYMITLFYLDKERTDDLIKNYLIFWDDIMISIDSKTKSEYDLFVDVYKIMNKYFFK